MAIAVCTTNLVNFPPLYINDQPPCLTPCLGLARNFGIHRDGWLYLFLAFKSCEASYEFDKLQRPRVYGYGLAGSISAAAASGIGGFSFLGACLGYMMGISLALHTGLYVVWPSLRKSQSNPESSDRQALESEALAEVTKTVFKMVERVAKARAEKAGESNLEEVERGMSTPQMRR